MELPNASPVERLSVVELDYFLRFVESQIREMLSICDRLKITPYLPAADLLQKSKKDVATWQLRGHYTKPKLEKFWQKEWAKFYGYVGEQKGVDLTYGDDLNYTEIDVIDPDASPSSL